MIRNFIYQKGRSEKFFTIEVASDFKSIAILQGQKHGDAKKPEKETFASKELCEKKTETLVKAKLKEGYEEVPIGIKNVNPFDLKILADAKKQKSEKLKIDVNQSVDLMNEILTLEFLEDLEIHNVSEIPDRLGLLKNLNDLEIRDSKNLKTIPSSLGELTSLTRLTIERTGISTLPDSLGDLKNLTNLYVQHNEKLEGLPDCIGSLKSLKLLWASYNREGEDKKGKRPLTISNAIGNLENLDELNLCSNGLSELPSGLANLKNLTELELNFNLFKNIPECIFEMENLEVLQMIYCPIRSIPKEFTKLENLSRLELEGHEIKNVPEEILEEGVEAIREFLSDSPEKKETRSIVSEGADLKQSLESHKDSLDKFYRAVKGKMYQENTRKKFAELQKYLQGESDQVPQTVKDDLYYFQPITEVLSSFRNWSAVDHRILAYITQGSWAFDKNKKGFFESFYRWLGREVTAHPEDSSLFADVLSALKQQGQDEAAILSERTHNVDDFVFTEDKKVTSIGRYLLDHGEELMPQFLKDSLPSSFVELYVREDFKKIEPHLEEITKIKEYDGTDGKKHIPLETFGILTRIKPELLEPIILDRFENIDCVSCKAELMYDLYEAMPKKYSEKTSEFAKSVLVYISEKKNSNIDRGYRFSWSLTNGRRYEDNTPEFIEWLLKNFGSSLKDEVFAYVEKTKVLDLKVTAVAVKYLGQSAIDIAGEALDMTIKNDDIAGHFRQAFQILSNLDYNKYYDKSWEIAKSEFKKVSETACMALSRLPEETVVPKAIELLKEKQSHVREAGALILSLLNTPKSIQGLKVLIETEKNDAVRNLASDLIYDQPNSISVAEAKTRIDIAKKLGKLEKPIAKWLDESKLPKIFWKDKKPLSADEVRYLFHRQKTVSEIVVDKELRDVIALVDKNSCKEFSEKLLGLILKNGGFKAPNRFAIGVLGILGNDSIVSTIETLAIKETNLNACACLGLIRSLDAALALDWIAQKFKAKYPNVREAAEEAFESIAFGMGLTPYELQDKMLPDFGFKGLSKKLNISKTEYTVKISPSLSFVYLNGDGKPVKTPPKQNETEKKKQKEENSLLKETARQFSGNLENSMVVQRKWSVADWKEFYLKNPVANACAQNFVWTFDSKGKVETNRFHLDGDKILTIEDKPVTIDEKAKIYLVHPYLLSEVEKKDWAEKFKTKDVKPTFPQLNRPIHLVPDGDKDKTMSRQFEDGEISGSTFKYRAKKYGWRRGSVVDAGEVSSYKKVFPGEEIEVFVKLEGMNVSSYDYDEKVTIKEFFFVNSGSIKTGSYVYDEPRGEEDFRLHSLQKVNPILYSETVYDLKRILETKDKDDEE